MLGRGGEGARTQRLSSGGSGSSSWLAREDIDMEEASRGWERQKETSAPG